MGFFLKIGKKPTLLLFIKNDKQSIKNYRPVSLLAICEKLFESFLYNNMFYFFIENDLISQNQTGFKLGDSCIKQLLSMINEIYKSFDDGWEVKSDFLDISKAFDKVWHQGVILKLKQNGISGNLLKIIEDFLSNRYLRVVLNGQSFGWAAVNAAAPKDQFLVLCFF